ncbi:MAG: hypothetical protein JNK45_11710 [Myxococcales bacterium]|nr:hypothetical protein [Myxococcales bacterium]
MAVAAPGRRPPREPLGWAGALGRGLALGLGLGWASACLPTPVFECRGDADCAEVADDARCEAERFCSVPDATCDSGRRFHEYAGDGLADACTDLRCGDGVVDGDEVCDDGNERDGDGCNRDCRPSGQEIWTQGYASPGFVEDRAYALAIDSAGNIAVIGHVTVQGEGANLWIRRFSSAGEIDWTWVKDGGAMLDEEGWSILVDGNDDFVVAGYVHTPDEDADGWLGKIGKDGLLVWDEDVDGGVALVDQIRGIAFAPDGDIVALGYATPDLTTDTELWFQRRSPDGATVRWTQLRAGLPDGKPDRGHGIFALEDDFIGVGYRQDADDRQHYWLSRFDGDGNDVWSEAGDPAGPEGVWTAVRGLGNGDLVLVGWREAVAGDMDLWLQRRDPAGALLWEEIVASPSGADDRGNVVTPAPDGGFVVGGEMGAGAGSTDAWLRRYTADNREAWTDTISGPAGQRDTIWGLGFGPDGNLVACGYISSPATSWDIWVRKYTP